MKALFIWKEESLSFLKGSILQSNQFKDIIEETGYSKNIKEEFLITNLKDWESKSCQINVVPHIYILVELGWNLEGMEEGLNKEYDWNHTFIGYNFALRILKSWKGKVPPSINFVSILSRNFLFENAPGELKYVVQVFNHLNLLDSNTISFPTKKVSIFEWNFFKNYALTSSGILDTVSHRLTSIQLQENNLTAFLKIIKEIKSQKVLLGEDIVDFISKIPKQTENTNTYIGRLINLIDQRKKDFKPNTSTTPITTPSSLKVMVIEDNQDHIDILKNSLERYFTTDKNLFFFKNGEKALNELKTNYKDFGLVLLDLELLDGNFYQPIQGVHIIEYLKSLDVLSFRVITGLGRKGVKELLQLPNEHIISKKQLYQFDTDEEVDKLLAAMVNEFKVKESKFVMTFGPQKSYFNWPTFKTILSEYYNDSIFREKIWEEAFSVLEKFKNKTLSIKNWPNSSKELSSPKNKNLPKTDLISFIENKFSSLLAHRLIILYLSSYDNFKLVIDNDHYNDFYDVLKLNKINLNKGYVERACLQYSSQDKEYFIKQEKLFPPEQIFVEELVKERNQEDAFVYINENSENITNLLKKYFDLEEEQYKKLNVISDIDAWTFNEFRNVWDIMYTDIENNLTNSQWYYTLKSFVDEAIETRTVETELEAHIPNIREQITTIFNIE